MIYTEQDAPLSLREMKEKQETALSTALMQKAEALAKERFGSKLNGWKEKYRAVWFLVIDADGVIEKIAVMKPINRHILSFASTKLEDNGLYSFLEQCMRECWLDGDNELLDDDEYFIPAAMKFNKVLEGKKAAFVKY